MYAQLCALLCIFVVGCCGRHICPLPTQPCRLSVVIRDSDNNQVAEASTDTCSCNGDVNCPTDWSNSSYVIRRKLISSQKIILKMMFCTPIQSKRICNRGEIALVVTGSLHLPNNVESHACKCHGNRPLHLLMSRVNEQHLREHSYVCAADKPICGSSSRCMEETMEGTRYPCRCRRNTTCRNSMGWPIYGQCV